jgi:DNA modification methylase
MSSEGVMVRGDARDLDRHLDRILGVNGVVDVSITSPPYGDLIDYGPPGQIGHGQTEDEYFQDMRRLLAGLFKRTSEHGSLWLIVDSYLESSRNSSLSRLRPLPFLISEIAEAEGWKLREIVIWRKDHTRPWTHHGKLRKSFEYVLLLVKSKSFRFHVDRLRESSDLTSWWVRYPERYHPLGKAPESVWDIPIPVQGSWANTSAKHACPLPVELVRRMVLLSSEPGDVVLDPFAGVGTVPAVATEMGRSGIGIELNPEFAAQYNFSLRREVREALAAAGGDGRFGPTAENIMLLRALKFPKLLSTKLRATRPELPQVDFAIVEIEDGPDPRTPRPVWSFRVASDASGRRATLKALEELARHAPLSKFGLQGEIHVMSPRATRELLGAREWHVYEHGRTWTSKATSLGPAAAELPLSRFRGAYIPIVSNRFIDIELSTVQDLSAEDGARRPPHRTIESENPEAFAVRQ